MEEAAREPPQVRCENFEPTVSRTASLTVSLTASPTVSPSLCLALPPSPSLSLRLPLCLALPPSPSLSLRLPLCLPHCVSHCLPHRLPHRLSHCVSHCVSHCLPHRLSHCVSHCVSLIASPSLQESRGAVNKVAREKQEKWRAAEQERSAAAPATAPAVSPDSVEKERLVLKVCIPPSRSISISREQPPSRASSRWRLGLRPHWGGGVGDA
jgi:hypothetical protein